MSRSISGELSHKIIIAIAVLVLGGIAGIIAFSGRVVSESVQKTAKSSLDTYIKDVESMLKEVEPMENFITWQIQDMEAGPEALRLVCEKVLEYSNLVSGVTVAMTKQPLVGHTYIDPATGKTCYEYSSDYSDETWILYALNADAPVWYEPCTGPYGGKITAYSSVLKSPDGEALAAMFIEIPVESIATRLEREHFYENSYSVILSAGGLVISHPDSTMLLGNILDVAKERDDRKLAELADNMISGNSGVGEVRSEKAAAIYGPLSNGWSTAMICPANEIFGAVVKFQLIILLIALGDLFVLYFVTRAIIGRTLLPITEVTYLAKNVAKGNFKAEIPKVEGHNEMFYLHESLRSMLHSINDYISQLKSTTAINERFESELAIASNIQQQMLRSDFINDKDVDIFATLKPAKEVGGDMYDFLRAGKTVYFAVGDVSGKGVPAALYMAISRSLFHYVSEMSMSTSNIVSCINSSFCSGNESNMFITLFVGRLDLETREMVFCNAGHNPIVIISPSGKAEYIHAKSNIAAGVFNDYPYEKECITVEKGSRLLIYTDGVTEAEDSAKNQFGEERLLAFANSQSTDTPSDEFVGNLLDAIKAFTGENDQNDDITIMSVKV